MSANPNGNDAKFSLSLALSQCFVLFIWTLVFGADLEFGAWKLVRKSSQFLKVILDRSVDNSVLIEFSIIQNPGFPNTNTNTNTNTKDLRFCEQGRRSCRGRAGGPAISLGLFVKFYLQDYCFIRFSIL